ncbi:hypothetical protein Tco_1176490 [Tanacetum coccineum]
MHSTQLILESGNGPLASAPSVLWMFLAVSSKMSLSSAFIATVALLIIVVVVAVVVVVGRRILQSFGSMQTLLQFTALCSLACVLPLISVGLIVLGKLIILSFPF